MGYRTRLGRINKEMKNAVQGMSHDEVCKHFGIRSVYRNMPDYEELHEIGKYIDFSDGTGRFFDFDVYEETEAEFFIMTKEQLAKAIKSYADDVQGYYQELLDKFRNPKHDTKHEIDCLLREKADNWSQECVPMYYLDEERHDGNITPSWKKEYAIFNLVEIYRNFDWENDYLIYSSW